ncbi:vomeronasal type-2 receptor 26-like, partial [Pelobates cultripes]
ISYGATDTQLSDRLLYPYFFRTVQDDRTHHAAIVKMLKFFGWNWVGIITSEDESGERELRELSQELTSHGICIEYTITMPDKKDKGKYKDMNIIEKATSQVLITCGSCAEFCAYMIYNSLTILKNITLLINMSWLYALTFWKFGILIDGSLTFTASINVISKIKIEFNNVNPVNRPKDPLLEDLWIRFFQCNSPNHDKNEFHTTVNRKTLHNCTGRERFKDIISISHDSQPYFVVYAVYAMALALHRMYLSSHVDHRELNAGKYNYKHKVNI